MLEHGTALTGRALNRYNAWAAIRKRAKAAGFLTPVGCHTWRATGITIYLENDGRSSMPSRWLGMSLRGRRSYTTGQRTKLHSASGANPAVTFDRSILSRVLRLGIPFSTLPSPTLAMLESAQIPGLQALEDSISELPNKLAVY